MLVNSHITVINDELFWTQNEENIDIALSNVNFTDAEILQYIALSFDLENGPLYRILLSQFAEDKYHFILVCHHIVMDGTAITDCFAKLAHNYNNKCKNQTNNIELQIERITTLNKKLITSTLNYHKQYKDFWQLHLENLDAIDLKFLMVNRIGIARPQKYKSKEHKFTFNNGEAKQIQHIARNITTTPFLFGQAIFAYLLSRYTNQQDFGISYQITIKNAVDTIYGPQINTSIMPYHFNHHTSIKELLEQVTKFVKITKGQNNEQYRYSPIYDVISTRNKSLLNVGFSQSNITNIKLSLDGCGILKEHNWFNVNSVHRLLFDQNMVNSELHYRICYDDNYIDENLLINFLNSYQRLFKNILNDIVNGINKPLREYPILEEEDYQREVYNWNQTAKPYRINKTIAKLFEEQVERTPDNIAIVFTQHNVTDLDSNTRPTTKHTITYHELNERANQLAHYLIQTYNPKPDDLIILCLNRDEYVLIGILAILKSGAAYVPLDPHYPIERINYILEDTRAKVFLTNENKIEGYTQTIDKAINFLAIDSVKFLQELEHTNLNNPLTKTLNNNLAYVMYTSGTTGKPKGVMIENMSYIAVVESITRKYFRSAQKITTYSLTNYVFDIFGLEYGIPLLNGGYVELGSHDFEYLDCKDYSFIQMTPSVCELKFDKLFNTQNTLLFVGGEKLEKSLLYKISTKNINLINMYGPTETTIWSTNKTYIASEYKTRDLPVTIGQPLDNQTAYVLDKNLEPLPIGAIGELHIGGIGVARGYINNDELTNQKFITDPFQQIAQSTGKLYKTGDLVRRLSTGDLEFIGRNDSQIKLQGHRLELGEVEFSLSTYPGIKQSVVITRNNLEDYGTDNIHSQNTTNTETHVLEEGNNNQYLVAYFVADINFDETELKHHLASKLPRFMVPNIFIRLDKLPLMSNGKLDTRSLPRPEVVSRSMVEPTKLEQQIIEIWSNILNLPPTQISTRDDFFRLGGNSILLIKLKNQLSEILCLNNIKITDLFKYTTVEQQVRFTSIDKNLKDPIQFWGKPTTLSTDIAIIGISCAFSGAPDNQAYWNLIEAGECGLTRYTLDECRERGVSENILHNPEYIPVAGHIKDIDKFDPEFWSLSYQEGKQLDPQIRKLLEHCWNLLENAGYILKRKELNIGVFVGASNDRYTSRSNSSDNAPHPWGDFNLNTQSILATKISYLLGLTGPSINLNTACSTSLVAIIEACKSLTDGYSNMAIAGGSSLLLLEEMGYIYQEGMIFSKDGTCRVFDHDASGTVAGSGVGVVLLKRLSDAEKDGDQIIGVIRGYAVNNDGNRKISYTAPSITGQKECIINAQKMAGVKSNQIDYVECHGTGTKLGDPIEIQALHEAFNYNASTHTHPKCVIGSVKSNIGHTDVVAGIAGLIKVCNMLEHGVLPKQINYNSPNPELNLQNTNFVIQTESMSWVSDNLHRFAGISSFGIGGTNAHLIISDYVSGTKQYTKTEEINNTVPYIIPLSAKTRESLDQYKSNFITYLQSTKDHIHDIAYTLQTKREFFAYRESIVCKSTSEAIQHLICSKTTSTHVDQITESTPHNIIFVFPGQGSQYINMSLNLYKNDSDYQQLVDQCIKIINQYLKLDFKEILFPELFLTKITHDHDINQTKWAQPALFIVCYSLAKLIEKFGIKPDAYIGHSIGELVAATLSGVFNLEDALKLVVIRGNLMQQMPTGSMLAVESTTSSIQDLVENLHCEISVINSIKNCVISGTNAQISELQSKLHDLNIASTKLQVSHAYHSQHMNKAAQKFVNAFREIELQKPLGKFISNVTGSFITEDEAINPWYWSRQIKHTVQFAKGIKTLISHYPNSCFIIAGPGNSPVTFIKDTAAAYNMRSMITIPLLSTAKSTQQVDIGLKEDILAKMWASGIEVNFLNYYHYSPRQLRPMLLPTYSFSNKSYWIKANLNKTLPPVNNPNDMFYTRTWQRTSKLNTYKTQKLNRKILIFNNCDDFLMINQFIKKLQILELEYLLVNLSQTDHDIESNIMRVNLCDLNQVNNLIMYLHQNDFTTDMIWYFSTSSLEISQSDGLLLYYLINNILTKLDNLYSFVSISYNDYEVIGSENLNPFTSIAVGITKSLPIEYPHLNARHYDFLKEEMEYIDLYINELLNIDIASGTYVIRNYYKWIPIYVKNKIIKSLTTDELPLLQCKTFLITGGCGGVGLTISEYIVKHVKNVRIILVGRRNEEQLGDNYLKLKLQAHKNKVSISYIQCDISSPHINTYLLKKLMELKIDKINLLLHAAGVGAKNSLDDINLNDIKNIINPKVNGTVNLIDLSSKIKVDTLVNFSSITSIVPSFGNMVYTAANTFLDEISFRKFDNIKQIITLNLNLIIDKGMGYHFFKQSTLINNPLLNNNIQSKELPSILNTLLSTTNGKNIILSKYDLTDIIENTYKFDFNKPETQSYKCITEINYGLFEQKIATVFCEVLGVDKLSIYDSFFALGGTSIAAIKLITKLRQIGVNLPLSKVMTLDSVDKIYQAYKMDVINDASDKIILPLRINNNLNHNIFFIHPVGGSIIFYMDLVKGLNPRYNYYGIQNINIYGEQLIQAKNIEELSKIYVTEILKTQPIGEYILMGSSMGGTIAYEIANQLKLLNKTVKFVAMFDSWAIFADNFYDENSFKMMMTKQIKYDENLNSNKLDFDYDRLILTRWELMKLLLNYTPAVTDINIQLYKALELDKNHIKNGSHADNGWQRYTSSPLKIYNIPGSHDTIHSTPGLNKIILLLNESLEIL